MANCPIKNTKLLEEAFDAGYYRGLQEQNGTGHPLSLAEDWIDPHGALPPYVPPSLSSAGIQQYQGKFSTAARGGKGSQSSPWGAGPDIRNLPPWYDGSSSSAMAWFQWFFTAITDGTLPLAYSMPPQLPASAMADWGWSADTIEQVQTAFDALTEILYPGGQPVSGGWTDINSLMYILAQWQGGTPPIEP